MDINKQKARKQENNDYLEVKEVFRTIQGEGPFTGQPAVFVRLAGCNLLCKKCDTNYTGGGTYQVGTLIEIIESFKTPNKLVVITGGEPFRQNFSTLANTLVALEYYVQVETNGTLAPLSPLRHGVVIVCSPKLHVINEKLLPRINYLKYVLNHKYVSMFDGLPTQVLGLDIKKQVARPPENFVGTVYVQPEDSQDEEENRLNLQAAIDSCMTFGWTLQLQQHKQIGMR
jgi:organic radical activating enzyme